MRHIATLLLLSCLCAPVFGKPQEDLTQPIIPSIAPGYEPPTGSLEGDLWSSVEKAEDRMKRSPLVITDGALNDYVNRILCRLEPDVCQDIRVYIVRNPSFNAFMAPNGMMVIWTGLMLRMESEAQLAAVIGHEMGHYLRQHSLQNWRSMKATANSGMILSLITAAAGVGAVGDLINLGLMAQLMKYNQNHETEADIFGAQRMAYAGYDPGAAASVWRYVDKEENEAIYRNNAPMIFRSHPRNADRYELLNRLAKSLGEEGDRFASNYWTSMTPYYLDLIDDQLKTNKPGRMTTLLTEHESFEINPSLVSFAWGEFYKTSRVEADQVSALNHFRNASSSDHVPPAVWREIGILEMKKKNHAEAHASLTRYLEAVPDAEDASIVRFYLTSLEAKL